MPIVLQPIDQTAKAELAQQLACWARTATGFTDVAVQFGTCCVSPTGETLGRWTIPNDLCTTYGPLPFTGNNGETITCPPTGSAEYVSYYIYDADVDPIDVDTCTPLVALAAPTALAAGTPTDTTIPLTWTASANADGYTVSYSSDGGTTWLEVQATASPFTLTGLTPETEYTIRIRATDSTNTFAKSPWTATVTATTESSLPELAVPANLATGTMTSTTAPLTWDAVANAVDYHVQYKETSSGTWLDWAPDPAGTSTTVTGLTASTSYDFRVRANADDISFSDSDYSAAVTDSTTA
jgi:hypothetical protein